MHANLPDIANRWEAKYGLGGIAELNQELNSLPAYYLPKNQGGRIGFAEGPKIPEKFLDDLKRKNYYKLLEEYRRWKEDYERRKDLAPTQEAAQGGLIPAHEAGIYGLAEGGQLVKPGPGRQGYNGQGDYTPDRSTPSSDRGPRDAPDRFGPTVSTTAASEDAYTIPTQTVTAPGDGDAREKYISEQYKKKRDIYGDVDLEEQQAIDREIGLRRLQQGNISKQERQNLEVGLGLRAAQPKMPLWKKIAIGASIFTGVAPILGIEAPGAIKTVAQFNSFHNEANFALDKFNKFNNTNYTLDGLFNKVTETKKFRTEEKLRAETKKLQEALPPGHPERIALEVQKKTRTTDTVDRDGVTQDTSIKIENIEEVNDAKTQLLRKYQEMNDASRLAWQRQQQMNRDKQMAYYQMFRKRYMAAGGRVPQGYNTGGLSNLFKLKNV